MTTFAIVLGIAIVLLGEEGRRIYYILALGFRTMIGVVRVITCYALIAVLGQATWLVATHGPQMLSAYARFPWFNTCSRSYSSSLYTLQSLSLKVLIPLFDVNTSLHHL